MNHAEASPVHSEPMGLSGGSAVVAIRAETSSPGGVVRISLVQLRGARQVPIGGRTAPSKIGLWMTQNGGGCIGQGSDRLAHARDINIAVLTARKPWSLSGPRQARGAKPLAIMSPPDHLDREGQIMRRGCCSVSNASSPLQHLLRSPMKGRWEHGHWPSGCARPRYLVWMPRHDQDDIEDVSNRQSDTRQSVSY